MHAPLELVMFPATARDGYPELVMANRQIYSSQGDIGKAIEVHEQMSPLDPFRAWALSISYAQAGRKAEAQELIDALSINATPRNQLHIALAYSAMGETEQALNWLNIAYENRSDWLPWIVLPYAYGGSVEPIREEPGYQAIVQALNLPAGIGQ